MIALSEKQLEDRLQQLSRPLAVAFLRAGAAPAQALRAALERAAPQLQARMDVARVDIDACARLVDELRIHRVPELLVWTPGPRLIARMEGAMSEDQVLAYLEHAATR